MPKREELELNDNIDAITDTAKKNPWLIALFMVLVAGLIGLAVAALALGWVDLSSFLGGAATLQGVKSGVGAAKK